MFKTWFIAMRPWSFTASFIPVALGTALAWNKGPVKWSLFFLTLIGSIAVQAGTNLINTYGDYIAGVDSIESAKTCPQLVTGILKPKDMKAAGILAFIFAAFIGLWLTYFCGWPIFAIGLIGIVAGYCYTAGWCPYKYKGLGSIFVFFLMGPLITWPTYYIQTGYYSWLPIWASLPIGFLVTGILHSNDLRDMSDDRRAGITTLALVLGLDKSITLYFTLYSAAFACLIVLILIPLLPWTALLPLALAPIMQQMFRLARDAAKGSHENLELLEAAAAKFHLQFGLLLVVGLVLYPFLQKWPS